MGGGPVKPSWSFRASEPGATTKGVLFVFRDGHGYQAKFFPDGQALSVQDLTESYDDVYFSDQYGLRCPLPDDGLGESKFMTLDGTVRSVFRLHRRLPVTGEVTRTTVASVRVTPRASR